MLEENEQDEIQYATLQQNLLTALRSHFIAKRDRSIANLNNYLNNPAGIGETQILLKNALSFCKTFQMRTVFLAP